MLEIIKEKIKSRLIFIQKRCYDLKIIEYQYFLIQMSQRITTSGKVKLLNQRLQNEHALNVIASSTMRDKYFLELAKLYEDESRNETNSFPNLKVILERNLTVFDKSLREQISHSLSIAQSSLAAYQSHLQNIKLHRDKCLGHNDKKAQCDHLDDITSLDTNFLIEVLIEFTNRLSNIFGYKILDTIKLQEEKDNMSSTTYERIKKMEMP